VSPDDLRQAMQDILQTWATPLLDDPEALQQRGGQSYTVLTLCRILYTLSYGTVASKREAARWAQAMLDPRWHPLIERTWEGRRHPGLDASPDDIRDTRAFIRYTLNRTFDVRSPWRTQAERQKEGTNDRQTFT
ncbi:MAG: DUF4111 domain-containing protein, partial [Anaerolineae bacterium]|nr:DUF4111 domain-containing protein [Anaerolineae bacterium]